MNTKKNALTIAIILFLTNSILAQFANVNDLITVQTGATLVIGDDFSNSSASQFVNNGTVVLKGNIKNQQVMANANLGTWEISGTSLQSFTGGTVFNVKNIIFDNAAGFSMGVPTPIRINGIATFKNGVLKVGGSSWPVYFSAGASLSNSPSPSNVSHINGHAVKEGVGSFTFPIGDATKYQPMGVNLASNSQGFIAKYFTGDIGIGNYVSTGTDPTPLLGYNSSEFWDIGPTTGGNAMGNITLYWDGQNETFPGGYSTRKVAHKVGANWLNEGTSAIGEETSGSVTSNTLSSWSPFTVGYVQATALPITLINFTGKKVGDINQLNWQTSQEINASHFDIERSSDAKAFEKIGEIGLNESKKYEFQDHTPPPGAGGLYRLKLIDLDDKYQYSKIISITDNSENEVVGDFYPNPAMEGITNIDINSQEKEEWTIVQFDISGKLLKTEKRLLEKGINKVKIEVLYIGLNVFSFESGNIQEIRKVIR